MADNNEADNIKKIFQKILLNTQDTKKKPYDIKINNNRNEPKIKGDIRYSAKQNYRRYKTKVEPNLHSNIKIDEEDDIVSAIKKEFEKYNRDKKAEEVITSDAPYIKEPEKAKDPETTFSNSIKKDKAIDSLAGKLTDNVLEDALAEINIEDALGQIIDELENEAGDKSLFNLDISEVSDIDPMTQESLTGQIEATPFTPEVRFGERNMSALTPEERRSELKKQLEQVDEQLYLVDRNFSARNLQSRLKRASQQRKYQEDKVSATNLQSGVRRALQQNTYEQDKKVLLKALSSSVSEMSEATTIGSTPSGNGKRGKRPMGRTLDLTNLDNP